MFCIVLGFIIWIMPKNKRYIDFSPKSANSYNLISFYQQKKGWRTMCPDRDFWVYFKFYPHLKYNEPTVDPILCKIA